MTHFHKNNISKTNPDSRNHDIESVRGNHGQRETTLS